MAQQRAIEAVVDLVTAGLDLVDPAIPDRQKIDFTAAQQLRRIRARAPPVDHLRLDPVEHLDRPFHVQRVQVFRRNPVAQ